MTRLFHRRPWVGNDALFSWFVAAAALLLIVSTGAGCSSGNALPANDAGSMPADAADTSAPDTSVPDDAATSDATPSNAVWPDNASKMVAEDKGGGFVGPAPTGSACPSLRQGTFTLTMADKRLAWHVCQSPAGSANGPYQYVDGSRVLDDAGLASLVDALKMVTVSTRNICGADKETLALTVTTPAGDKTYLDDFYACNAMGVYVDNIDAVFTAARALVQ